MKRYAVLLIVLVASLLVTRPLFAQSGGDALALNDAAPAIEVVITPLPGTSGAVVLELAGAGVSVTDTAGNMVFQVADSRVHQLELRLAPGTGAYTLTAERLPGVVEAYLRITGQADLTDLAPLGDVMLVANPQQPVGMQQAVDLPLNQTTPSQVTGFSIPADQQGTMQVTFPGAPVTAQVVDGAGQVVATLAGSGFDGFGMVLDGGDYSLTLLDTNPAQTTLANLRVQTALPSTLNQVIPQIVTQQSAAVACSIKIGVASVNLRSGPGTGYSVLDYGYRNDEYPVGGTNPDGSWLVVADQNGESAWLARSTGALSETCPELTVYDIPYREALPPQVVVVQQPPQVITASAAPSGAPAASPSHHDDDDDDDDHDDEEDDD